MRLYENCGGISREYLRIFSIAINITLMLISDSMQCKHRPVSKNEILNHHFYTMQGREVKLLQ